MEESLIRFAVECNFGEHPPRSCTGFSNGPADLQGVLSGLNEERMKFMSQVPTLIAALDMDKVHDLMGKVSEILLLQHILPAFVSSTAGEGRHALKYQDVNVGYLWIERISR